MAEKLIRKFNDYERTKEWLKLYQRLRFASDEQERKEKLTVSIARQSDNAGKNRYRDVSAYDQCRIKLYNRSESEDYINATPVEVREAGRKYILSQGPLPGTTNDFWEMAWQEKSRAIIMLNKTREKEAIKCHQYYPAEKEIDNIGKELMLDSFVINLISERHTDHFVVRELRVRRRDNDEGNGSSSHDSDSISSHSNHSQEDNSSESDNVRLVTHYQFTTWPDFGVPQSAEDFLEFLQEVRESGYLDLRKYGPPIVHCSAGIGRSGTFVIVDAILVMVKFGIESDIDLCDLVLKLRKSRMGLIQTMEQLRFSWKAVVDAISEDRWRPLMEATCADRPTSPSLDRPESPNSRRLDRGVANQLTTGDHWMSVDESELRKRSIVDIQERNVISARVGMGNPMGAGVTKRRSTSLVDDRSPPIKRHEHDLTESDDDGEDLPPDPPASSGSATGQSKTEERRRKVEDMRNRMRQSELQRHGVLLGMSLPTLATWGAGAAVVVALGFFCYYRF